MKKILSNKYNMKETIRAAKRMRERERIASQHRNILGQEYAGLQITLYFKGKCVIVLMLNTLLYASLMHRDKKSTLRSYTAYV